MHFLKSMLSESGKTSSNRVFAMITTLFLLVNVTIISVQTGTLQDIGTGWLGLIGVFVSASLGGKAVKGFAKNTEEGTSEPQQ